MNTIKMSRREAMQLSTAAIAGLSFGALKPGEAVAQSAPPQPQGLVDTKLPDAAQLALKPDGSAVEYPAQEAGNITGGLLRTKKQKSDHRVSLRKNEYKTHAARTPKTSL